MVKTTTMNISKMALLFLICSSLMISAATSVEPPNFILILADDLGYADIGCFGSKHHRTPNIDKLASEGIRFTDFYVTSGVCTPSRSSLMTGCYPRRVNMHKDHANGWVLFPRSRKGLHNTEVTIAEVLKSAGYATAIVGKWHLGDQPPFLPTRQGFDSYFGIPYSNDMGWTDRKNKNYPPLPVLRNETVIEQEPDQRYLTQRYTHEAITFIKANKDRPFFLYLPHTMPHWPQYSSEHFAGKSQNGKWGDAVEEIDWSTGLILDQLMQLGIDDRTLVVFLSDNGGAIHHGAVNKPLKGGKGSTFEGGQRVCCVARWPQQIPAGAVCTELATSMDMLPTIAGLAGTTPPEDRKIDGHDIWPLLSGVPNAKSPYEAFYYYFRETLECVRQGKWKLRLTAPRKKPTPQFQNQLFDLDNDIGETTDVADQHPNIVERLLQLAGVARADLGDHDREGTGQRAAGYVGTARGLTDGPDKADGPDK